jgi:hypothetical protein
MRVASFRGFAVAMGVAAVLGWLPSLAVWEARSPALGKTAHASPVGWAAVVESAADTERENATVQTTLPPAAATQTMAAEWGEPPPRCHQFATPVHADPAPVALLSPYLDA